MSLIQIAETMLKHSPLYSQKPLSLFAPGSLLEQKLVFPAPEPVLFASRNNPGATEVAAEVHRTYPQVGVTHVLPLDIGVSRRRSSLSMLRTVASGQHPAFRLEGDTASTRSSAGQDSTDPKATHFLVYLNLQTFKGAPGQAFAREFRAAWAAGLPIALIHEEDEARRGCTFNTFFETSAQQS